MIDVKILRENPESIRQSQVARGEDPKAVDELVKLEAVQRDLLQKYEELRAEQNAVSKKVGQAEANERQAIIEATKRLANEVQQAKDASDKARDEFISKLSQVQNVILGAPSGGEEDYNTLEEVGAKRDFKAEGFEPKDHLELGEGIKAIDVERGAKISGTRFYFLTGIGARFELALINMGIEYALENGFTPMVTPTLVRPEIMSGAGFTDRHDDEIYRMREPDEQYLTGTSEVALAGYHKDEILDLSQGSKRYAGISTCYRREAGSHGKDVRGIIRVHQFNKVEMFSYATDEQAEAEHQAFLGFEKAMINKLELPFRVIDTAAGDLGSSAARKFDCEAWLPTQNRYLELTSTSNCTTFQARRMNTRYRDENGKTKTANTINGTLATTRWLVAFLENHQQKDGSIYVPVAFRKFLGGLEVIEPVKD
jgi:seryl-tRNA synthetase